MAYTTIDDPSAYFHTQLYTGTGSTNAITNDANAGDFSPDWLWVKNRTTAGGAGPNIVFDTTRGNTKDLHTNNTEAEHTNSHVLLSFDTDGFSVGTGGAVNNNTDNFVAWQWKANGGTTSSNTQVIQMVQLLLRCRQTQRQDLVLQHGQVMEQVVQP
jgi:hypothetical protein